MWGRDVPGRNRELFATQTPLQPLPCSLLGSLSAVLLRALNWESEIYLTIGFDKLFSFLGHSLPICEVEGGGGGGRPGSIISLQILSLAMNSTDCVSGTVLGTLGAGFPVSTACDVLYETLCMI